MKPLFCKLLFVVAVCSMQLVTAQETLFKNSFNATSKTELKLNLDRSFVALKSSSDSQIHINVTYENENMSEEDQKLFLSLTSIKASLANNTLLLTAKNIRTLDIYHYKDAKGIKVSLAEKENDTLYYTKEALMNTIDSISKSYFDNIIDQLRKNKASHSTLKFSFEIAIPENISVNIIGTDESKIDIPYICNNAVSILLKNSTLNAKSLTNKLNKISSKNGSAFIAENITNGTLTFDNVTNVSIGSIKDLKVNSKLSKIKVGELNQNIIWHDESSKIWLYNTVSNFNKFNYTGEFSTIYYFDATFDYDLIITGKKVAFETNGNCVKMEGGKNLDKLLEKKAKNSSASNGLAKFILSKSTFKLLHQN